MNKNPLSRPATSHLALMLGLLAPLTVFGQTAASGEEVYQKTCAACHATGVNKAPRYGDKTAWAPLIKEGQAVLSAEGWTGVRAMPARGGNPDLSLEAFASAVSYMARAGGANWQAPNDSMLQRIKAEVAKRNSKGKK